MATNTSPVNLHLSCHCRAFSSTLTLPSTSFPLKSALCHCSLCRHSTGHIFATFAVIPLPDKPSTTGLTGFDTSKDITRWFCSTCGCTVWNDDRGNNEWELATGIISGVTHASANETDPKKINRGQGSPEGVAEGMKGLDGLLKRVQLFIGSTGDGGGAIWLNEISQPNTQRYLEARHSSSVNDATISEMSRTARANLASGTQSNVLTAICACTNIHLTISRDTPATKFAAGMDACFSCRKTSGFEITSWASIPRARFAWAADGAPVTLDEPVFGKYSTTEMVVRYFCRGCGVPVICDILDGRDTWDIGVGLLRAEGEGTRVEGWLDWVKYKDGVQYVEDAIGVDLVESLRDGIWRDRGKK